MGLGLGGVGWGNNVHVPCVHTWCYAAATSWPRVWVVWGNNVHVPCVHTWCYAAATSWPRVWWCGVITFMCLACTRDATLRLRHGLGFGWCGVITFMCLACTRDATLRLRHGLGFGWCGVKTFVPRGRAACSCHWCFEMRAQTHKHARKSILVTDGAPCYPKLTSGNNFGHEACNHTFKSQKDGGHSCARNFWRKRLPCENANNLPERCLNSHAHYVPNAGW